MLGGARAKRFYDGLKHLDRLHRLTLVCPPLTLPLRLASYAAFRGLEVVLGGRHPHGRVVAQARHLAQGHGARLPSAGGRRVLFFTVRGWYIHVGTEAVLAKALELRGAETRFFLCGGTLAQCDFKPGTDPYVTRPLCWRCSGFAQRLLDAFELPYRTLEDVLDAAAPERARRMISALDRRGLRTIRYRDLPLFEIVQPSVQRSLLRGDVGEDELSERVLRGYLESAIVFTEVCEALLGRERPDVVVMTNGLFFAERLMLELARRVGVEAVTYERGMPLHTVLFDRNRPAVRFELDECWAWARAKALSDGEGRELDAYLGARATGSVGSIELWPRMEQDRTALAERFGLSRDKPLAVVFTNILWDSAVFDRDVAFDGMFDWLLTTVRIFAERPDAQLVIRVHPSEVRIPMAESRDRVMDRLRRTLSALPPNVRIVPPEDPASSYTLIALAEAVVVYTSTVGLEAAVRGRRVVIAGRTHYRGRGFSVDVERREDYAGQLRDALQGRGLAAEEIELARRYAYLFFFRFMHPFPWITDAPRAERRLNLEDLAELAPGKDPVLDHICSAILDGTPFVSVD